MKVTIQYKGNYNRQGWGEVKPEHEGDAGFDLRAAINEGVITIPRGEQRIIPCGIMMAIEDGYEGQVRPRSGLAAKHHLTVLNSPGTIDSGYRGEIKVILMNHGFTPYRVVRGDKIAQMVFHELPKVELVHIKATDKLPKSSRGEGGFGSTGKS